MSWEEAHSGPLGGAAGLTGSPRFHLFSTLAWLHLSRSLGPLGGLAPAPRSQNRRPPWRLSFSALGCPRLPARPSWVPRHLTAVRSSWAFFGSRFSFGVIHAVQLQLVRWVAGCGGDGRSLSAGRPVASFSCCFPAAWDQPPAPFHVRLGWAAPVPHSLRHSARPRALVSHCPSCLGRHLCPETCSHTPDCLRLSARVFPVACGHAAAVQSPPSWRGSKSDASFSPGVIACHRPTV